jgi:hypothetical protein
VGCPTRLPRLSQSGFPLSAFGGTNGGNVGIDKEASGVFLALEIIMTDLNAGGGLVQVS